MHKVYVFDAYGTLFDVNSAVAKHKESIGQGADRLAEMWRIKQIEYTWNYSLIGRYRDFRDLTAAALDFAATTTGGLPDGLRSVLLDAYEQLDAYPDVASALRRLRQAGAKTAILSNGTPAMLGTATRAAGLDDLLDAVISVEDVRVYKTSPAVYDLIGARFGTTPAEISFQSSNRWDIAGATAYGFRTVWVNRTGKPDEYLDLAPARTIESLEALD